MQTVKIISREVAQDKNGKNYAKLQVETGGKRAIIDEFTGQRIVINVPTKRTSFLAWEKSYLDEKPQFGWDLKEGDLLAGTIVTRQVTEYEIPVEGSESRVVNTYTCFVPGDTNDESFHAEVLKAFTRAGREIIDENGLILNPIKPSSTNIRLAVKETVSSDFDA